LEGDDMENLANEFINDLALLCGEGENAKWKELVLSKINNSLNKFTAEDAFGYRQLNEILLFCNKNIITKEFFLFLSEGQPTIKFGEFHIKVEKFRKLAMLQFGSIIKVKTTRKIIIAVNIRIPVHPLRGIPVYISMFDYGNSLSGDDIFNQASIARRPVYYYRINRC